MDTNKCEGCFSSKMACSLVAIAQHHDIEVECPCGDCLIKFICFNPCKSYVMVRDPLFKFADTKRNTR